MESLQIGPYTPMINGVVYAIPPIGVGFNTSAGTLVQTSIFPAGPFINTTGSSGQLIGAFVRNIASPTNIRLTALRP